MKKFIGILLSFITLVGASIGIFTAVKSTDWYKDKFDKSTSIVEDSSTSTPSEDTGDVIDYEQAYNELVQNANGATLKFERTKYNISFDIVSGDNINTISFESDKVFDHTNVFMSLDNSVYNYMISIINNNATICNVNERDFYSVIDGEFSHIVSFDTKTYIKNDDFNITYNANLINLSDIDLDNLVDYENCYFTQLVSFQLTESSLYVNISFLISSDGSAIVDYLNNL